jgi:hypothetical protein
MFLRVYSQLIKKLSEMVNKGTETSIYPITSENTVFLSIESDRLLSQRQIAEV